MPMQVFALVALAALALGHPGVALAVPTYDDPQRYEAWNALYPYPEQPLPDAMLEDGQHVLTAAHCVDVETDRVRVSFNLGYGPDEIVAGPDTITVHQHWSGSTEQGVDLAIIRLSAATGIRGYRLWDRPLALPFSVQIAGWGPSGQGAADETAYPFGTLRRGWNHYDEVRNPAQHYVFDFDSYSEDGTHNAVGEPGWITYAGNPPFRSIIQIDNERDGARVNGEVFITKGDSGGATYHVLEFRKWKV